MNFSQLDFKTVKVNALLISLLLFILSILITAGSFISIYFLYGTTPPTTIIETIVDNLFRYITAIGVGYLVIITKLADK